MTDLVAPGKTTLFAGESEQKAVVAFLVMFKTARLMEPSNEMYRSKLSDLMSRLESLQQEHGTIEIKIHSDYFFFNEKAIRLTDDVLSSVLPIVEEWGRLRIGGFRLREGILADTLSQFIGELARTRANGEQIEEIAAQLRSLGLDGIELLGVREQVDSQEELTPEEALKNKRQWLRQSARSSFFKSMETVKTVMQQATEHEDIDAARTRRVVRSLIDRIMVDESSLLELTSLRDYDDYTYAHSTNVCVYSLMIGIRLNMDRSRLSQLGFGALFHDIGKVRLPRDLICKPDAFDENDWVQMQQHPTLGAKTILRNMELNPHTARAARVAFEHHINTDFTGYPLLRYRRRSTTLISKIVAVADSFDALTSGRIYMKKVLPPDEVLKKMRFQMTVKFDSLILKIFNDIIGAYPAGSLVLLSTNELALVLTRNDKDRSRPYVKIVGNQDGLYPEAKWADLASAEYVNVHITRLVDPEKHGLNLSRFVLND